MNITSTLIEKFLAGECDPDETERILGILADHPGLLETYLGEQEWRDIGLEEATMPDDARRRIHSYVMQHTAKKNRATVVTTLKWVAAASIIIVLGWGGWQWFYKERSVEPVANVHPSTPKSSIDTLVSNNNSLARRILLKDGSEIVLSAYSTVQYQPAFNNKERVIYLKGEAFFKVAKNKQRPFTVYSHGIATTALGTSFTIRALENESTVKVILHTGKVMVQRVAANGGKEQEGNNPLVYLLPGDQLAVNILTYQTTLTHTKPDPAAPGAISVPTEIPAVASATLHFDRTPLAEVFQKLQQQYQTVILFDEAALSEMSFTGKLQPTESLESVLQKIAFLNELIVTKTTEGYHIRVNH